MFSVFNSRVTFDLRKDRYRLVLLTRYVLINSEQELIVGNKALSIRY